MAQPCLYPPTVVMGIAGLHQAGMVGLVLVVVRMAIAATTTRITTAALDITAVEIGVLQAVVRGYNPRRRRMRSGIRLVFGLNHSADTAAASP